MTRRFNPQDDRGGQFARIAPGSRMVPVVLDEEFSEKGATLYVGGPGDVRFIPENNDDGETVTITVDVPMFIDQVTVRRVLASGTTATDIYAVS